LCMTGVIPRTKRMKRKIIEFHQDFPVSNIPRSGSSASIPICSHSDTHFLFCSQKLALYELFFE
jgi:hypothetical protein